MGNKAKPQMPDFSKMSDEELLGGGGNTPIQGGVTASAGKPQMPDFSSMSDDELLGGGLSEEPQEEEHPDFVQGAIQAGGQLGANLVQGYARGMDTLDRAIMSVAPKYGQEPEYTTNEADVTDFYKSAIQKGQQEHPILSNVAQSVGEAIPTLPAWEAGGAAVGGALKLGKVALNATGPLGGAMLSLGSKIPGALQNIFKLTTTGTGGAFVAGMQEEAGKPGGQGRPPNFLDMVKAGAKKAEEAAPVVAGLGVAGEAVGKIKAVHAAKMEAKVQEAAFKEQQRLADEQNALDERIRQQQETKQQREDYHQDMRRDAMQAKAEFFQKGYEKWFDELRKEQAELRKLQGTKVERRLRNHDLLEEEIRKRIQAAEENAAYFQEQHIKAAEEAAAELEAWGKYHAVPAAGKQIHYGGGPESTGQYSKELQASERADAAQAKAEYFEKNKEGVPRGTALPNAQQEMGEKFRPTGEQERTAVEDAERQAKSFVTGRPAPPPYKGGWIEPPKTPKGKPEPGMIIADGDPLPVFKLKAEKQGVLAPNAEYEGPAAQTSRGNRGRTEWEQNNPEEANEGFYSSIETEPDEAAAQALLAEEGEARKLFEKLPFPQKKAAEKAVTDLAKEEPEINNSNSIVLVLVDDSRIAVSAAKQGKFKATNEYMTADGNWVDGDVVKAEVKPGEAFPPKKATPEDLPPHTEMVPVSSLSKYREFDREANPMLSPESFEELKADIAKNGVKEPLILQYWAGDGKLLLAEGNHRLAIAKQLGLKELPVRVVKYNSKLGDGPGAFSRNPPKPNEHGYLPGDMKPSQVLSPSEMKLRASDSSELLGTTPEGLAIVRVYHALKALPDSQRNYNSIMQLCGIQKTSDIFQQYDAELAKTWKAAGKAISELHGGLYKQFKETAGKVSFANMGAGEMEQGVLQKGLRGKLTASEMKELTPEQVRYLAEAGRAIKDYRDKAQPILDFLNEQEEAGNLSRWVGLGRLRVALQQQLEDLGGLPSKTRGNGDVAVDKANSNLMKFLFFGKAANAVIHMGEKGVALAAKEGPIGFGKAIVDAYKPGSVFRKFNQQMGGTGPITEALEDVGVKAKTAAGKVLTGQVIERSPQDVATVVGLGKAAKKLGYADAETLAQDILDARQGKGPLAYDTQKVVDAMTEVQHYVSDLTGSNVPGLRDANIFQRNQKLKQGGLFLSMPGVQSRNFHLMVRKLAEAKGTKEKAAAAAVLSGYLFNLYVVAGDKGPIPKDVEDFARRTVGAPNWYSFMDEVHATRAAFHAGAIPHLQHSLSPIASGGGNIYEILRGGLQQASKDNPDTFDKTISVAKALGMAAGAQLLGLGGGVTLDYAKAARDSQRGYKMLKVYQHGIAGGEEHIADIPVESPLVESLASKYWGGENAHELELIYQAEKSHDLRDWVQHRVGENEMREFIQEEKEIDEISNVKEIKKEGDESIQELYDMGYAKNSPEVRKVKDEINAELAKGNTELNFYRARARYWQDVAKEVQQRQRKPMSSPKPQA